MAKIHVNDKGEIGVCTASIRDCPIGGEHYTSEEEARAGYEAKQRDNANAALKKSKKPHNEALILALSKKEPKELADAGFVAGFIGFKAAKPEVYTSISSARWEEIADAAKAGFESAEKDQKKTASSDNLMNVYVIASAAKWLSQDRLVNGIKIPKGHAIVQAVYDLDGNLIDADRSSSGPWRKKIKLSSKADPELRRAENEANGFRIGTAIYPIDVGTYFSVGRNATGIPVKASLPSEPKPKDVSHKDVGIREEAPEGTFISRWSFGDELKHPVF